MLRGVLGGGGGFSLAAGGVAETAATVLAGGLGALALAGAALGFAAFVSFLQAALRVRPQTAENPRRGAIRNDTS